MSVPGGLHYLPHAIARVDGGLAVIDCSRRCLALFGVRAADEDAEARLGQCLGAAATLGDELALATARLTQAGDEDGFEWRRDHDVYQVTITAETEATAADATFLVFLEDVTEVRRMEQIQLEARHYLEQILADVPLGVAVLDRELRVTFANAGALGWFGRIGGRRELVDVIGAELESLVPGDAGRSWQALCAQARDAGERATGDRETFDVDTAQLVLAVAAHPLHDRRGERSGAIVIIEDITEKAGLEVELIRMEKLATVGQMVITVNHEINNPLAIIATSAQSARLLNRDLDDKTRAKLERIEEQVKRISAVTERLRTMDEVTSNDYIADGPQMIDIATGAANRDDDQRAGDQQADGQQAEGEQGEER